MRIIAKNKRAFEEVKLNCKEQGYEVDIKCIKM